MLDNRIYTFLKLCELMNYRKTAEALNMTQPAVTQHIKFLEKEYGCKLFIYDGRKLVRTEKCTMLERHMRTVLFNEMKFREKLAEKEIIRLSVGATKTIGDYTIEEKVLELMGRDDIELELIIDNTDNLFRKLNNLELDVLLIEGFFDKDNYDYRLIKKEELVGICSVNHRFAGRRIGFDELFEEHIILREEGSGTRAVFEQFLNENGYSYRSFRKKSEISSFRLIESAAACGRGISFVYESIPAGNEELAEFRIENLHINHEFNYVVLKDAEPDYLSSLAEIDNF